MYESLRGTLQEKTPNQTILACGGISYRITTPISTYTRLPHVGSETTLYLSFIVREDAHILYGFVSKEERDLFETLITISGIGPKTAAAIVGHMEIDVFQKAIATSDIRLLSKMPGIGKKTAERLVIEMRDKYQGKARASLPNVEGGRGADIYADATNALINLGYNALDAHRAVQLVAKSEPAETDLGRLITAALRHTG